MTSENAIRLLLMRRGELKAIAPSIEAWDAVIEWHTRTRPLISKYFSTELSEFDKILHVRWVAFPRVIGPGIDNSETDAAERAGNQSVVRSAHTKFLGLIDTLVELHQIENSTSALGNDKYSDEKSEDDIVEMPADGEAIRKQRTLKGLSQSDLAAAAGVSNATVSRIEAGDKRVQPRTLDMLARVLGVATEDLLVSDGKGSKAERKPEASLSVTVSPYFHKRQIPLQSDLVFVLMPFMEPWSKYVWEEEIKTIVTNIPDQPLRCLRADDLFGQDVMIDIYESIASAAIVIADITNRNANVFYELGIAHTLGKAVILLAQGAHHIPFDLLRFRHCIYSNDGPGYKILRNFLPQAIMQQLTRSS